VAYHAGVRSWPRRTVKLRVQVDGPVLNLYRLERIVSEETEFLGYWTSDGVSHLADPLRQFAWVVLARLPRSYYPVRSEIPSLPQPPRPDNGSAVREPRRPMPPSLTGAAALPLPSDE
jgi:hypothetical protein